MSDVRAPPQSKKGKKPQWLLDQEARQKGQKGQKTEAKAEEKKERDATDMFSRSKDFKNVQASGKRREEESEEKRYKPTKEDGERGKRRRVSTEQEDEDAATPARKMSLTPSKRSLSLRSSSSSPQSLTKRYDAITTRAAKPETRPVVIALDSDDDDDDLYTAPPPKTPDKVSIKQQPTPAEDDEADIDPDEDFPELVKKARERAKQQELEKQRRVLETLGAGGVPESKSIAVEEGPNPTISLLIDPRIPDSEPLLVTRKWNQRLREVRSAWCERQGFVADFADTVIFTWRGIRVFDVASCKSLGIELDMDGKPILSGKDGIDETGEKLVLVATTQAIIEEEKKAAAEAEQKREDEANGITTAPAPAPEKKKIRIVLNAKDYPTHKLIVMEDTTFERIAHNFRRLQNVPDSKQITLMWDGDVLEPSDVMKNTEIEDMESIEVHIK